ncbi:cardiolipin synthase [Methyloversatilis sp.]|uniref:cardiolipin synthase n=1 Tax=Methyloversatilis sp. TaxID=2569862 RepID=UPI003F70767A
MNAFRPSRRWRAWLVAGGVAAAVLTGLAACSSLPVLVPDLNRHSERSVQLGGMHGPLSTADSAAILDRLRRRNPDSDLLERNLAREEALVDSPLTIGNAVRLLQDGPATYQAMLTAIAAARDHINMETYILDDDPVGQRFARALIERQRAGVQVNLIRDSAGTFDTPSAFFRQLTDEGVRILEFNPVNPLVAMNDWAWNQRNHRKLLIVDGQTAFLGGINISSVYSGGSFNKRSPNPPTDEALAWRDTDLQLDGPVVAELQKLFLAAWAAQKGEPLDERKWFPAPRNAGRQIVRAIGSSPEDAYSQIYVTLLSAIGSAEKSVRITNAYFAPDPQLLDTLEAAAARGVDVVLILPSKTDSWLVFHAGRGYYARLLEAGVRIYERQGVILHSKTALIDDVWATVGSTNLDWRSFLHNHELNAVVLGAEFGSQLKAIFERDLAGSEAITLEDWQRRPIGLRLKEMFSRLWEYWL